MKPNGKKKLIKSLSVAIYDWINAADPNSDESTDVGYVDHGFTDQLASLVVTALELNSASQRWMEKNDLTK